MRPRYSEPHARRETAIVDEKAKRRSMEQVRAHLARADSELEAAQRFLHPWTDEFEIAVVRAVANSRSLVGDAPETIGARIWE
jgi:glutathione S-transferase